jgi:hypothetical protein
VLTGAGLSIGPVLVLVGGAVGLAVGDKERLSRLFADHVVPVLMRCGASVVDGGTDSGVMSAMGSARSASGIDFQLVGVAAAGTVPSPGDVPEEEADAEVEANHSHIVLVPGETWGDESPWLAVVAQALSVGHASATLLVNGGEIAYDDVRHSLAAGRPVVVLAGSGRTADAVASAGADPGDNQRARQIAASPLVQVVPLDAPEVLSATLTPLLSPVTPGE